jgi:hypothetical protein
MRGPIVIQIAAALKRKSPAPLACRRLDITKPMTPTSVAIAASVGKNITPLIL